MKRLILGGLSVLLLSTTTVFNAHAQTSPSPASSTNLTTVELTPFDLVSLAYQGFLEDEGIPKFNRLAFEYRTGRFEAEDLVQAAIDTRRVPANTLSDRRYLSAVERQLDNLLTDTN